MSKTKPCKVDARAITEAMDYALEILAMECPVDDQLSQENLKAAKNVLRTALDHSRGYVAAAQLGQVLLDTRMEIKARRWHAGEFEVCAHRVRYNYDLAEYPKSPELIARLELEAEERAKAMINEGCISGELNCLYVFDNDKEAELRGWWEIIR